MRSDNTRPRDEDFDNVPTASVKKKAETGQEMPDRRPKVYVVIILAGAGILLAAALVLLFGYFRNHQKIIVPEASSRVPEETTLKKEEETEGSTEDESALGEITKSEQDRTSAAESAVSSAYSEESSSEAASGTQAVQFEYGGILYEVSDGKAVMLKCSSTDSFLTMENMIDGYPLVGIGDNCFSGCVHLEYADLGANIDYIADKAFAECTDLKEISIPDSVTWISDSAFENDYGITIIAHKGSLGEIYAAQHGIPFEEGTYVTP